MDGPVALVIRHVASETGKGNFGSLFVFISTLLGILRFIGNRSIEEGKLLMSYGILLMFGGKMGLRLAVAHLALYGYTTLKATIGRLVVNDVNSADVDLQNKNESNTS
ncbi:hypothetical protein ABFS82_08G096400 [Erythranthe guttata]|uniref:uncharacterized protein LOC105960746 n=1 Tax=Erythranthe guttata TaxID=4155 RepID=UPI00064D8337|nr:PREDICTED: uncharacterized protein LOC105960746 [Erythranthe guttata]|eukprot:XP_012840410.1 PREDICTED: uncharacterized protein LOC105960746 [Erythranthe guttata]